MHGYIYIDVVFLLMTCQTNTPAFGPMTFGKLLAPTLADRLRRPPPPPPLSPTGDWVVVGGGHVPQLLHI